MVTGLDKERDRADHFHTMLVHYRRKLRDAVRDAGSYTLEQEDALAIELERDLDSLMMQCANLAREPILRHMATVLEAVDSFAPSPLRVYPDPKQGASS